jgi:hypothetical protein
MNHNWTNTEECGIDMHKKEAYYRIINVNDPFVQKLSNASHDIGLNWKNEKFDFTGIIDAGIWNSDHASQYNLVRINESDGKRIKDELSTNVDYYLGKCSTGQANNTKVCELYNKATKG